MIKDKGNSIDRTAKQVEKLARDMRSTLEKTAHDALDLIGIIAQSDYFENVDASNVLGGYKQEFIMGAPSHPTKLTSRGGRLARSIGPTGGAFSAIGEREGIQEVKISGNTITGIKGSKVPYAAIHEYGGTIQQTVTDKQRSFFWALALQTGDEKFKAMALSKELNIKIPARPYLEPAGEKAKPKIEQLFRDRLEELASGGLEA